MPRKKTGRPTKYTEKLAAEICDQLSQGKSLRTVCAADNMPVASTVFLWMSKYPEFSKQYARAKEESADAMAEEVLDIADDGRNDWMEIHDKDGEAVGYKFNGEAAQRSKLRVDTRKWLMAKMKPKKYGDSLDLKSDGEKIQIAPIYGGRSLSAGVNDTADDSAE